MIEVRGTRLHADTAGAAAAPALLYLHGGPGASRGESGQLGRTGEPGSSAGRAAAG